MPVKARPQHDNAYAQQSQPKARPPYDPTHLRSPPLVACWPSPCILTPGTEKTIPGEQQADIPLEVEQQHPGSHGGTNGKSKNNASKGGESILWSLANDSRALIGNLSVMAQFML